MPSVVCTSCSTGMRLSSTWRAALTRMLSFSGEEISSTGRPMSESINLNNLVAAGVKRRIRSFSSRKTVATPVALSRFCMSLLRVVRSSFFFWDSLFRVVSSSLTDWSSSREVSSSSLALLSSSLVDMYSSLAERSSSLAVFSSSMVPRRVSRVRCSSCSSLLVLGLSYRLSLDFPALRPRQVFESDNHIAFESAEGAHGDLDGLGAAVILDVEILTDHLLLLPGRLRAARWPARSPVPAWPGAGG